MTIPNKTLKTYVGQDVKVTTRAGDTCEGLCTSVMGEDFRMVLNDGHRLNILPTWAIETVELL